MPEQSSKAAALSRLKALIHSKVQEPLCAEAIFNRLLTAEVGMRLRADQIDLVREAFLMAFEAERAETEP